MANKTWTMNDKQREFTQLLEDRSDGTTLFELKLEGKEFKTGTINVLTKKGIVMVDGEREFSFDVVFDGNKVGSLKRTYKVYKLVK